MIKISHLLPVLLLTTAAINARAQKYSNAAVVDVTGRPITNSKFLHIKGSPFIFDEWLPGEVVLGDGKLHTGMLLKYNLETNLVTFVYDPKEEPQKFAGPATAFTIFGERKMSFANNFPKFDGNGLNTYYQVIAVGRTMLLKHYRQFLKNTTSAELSQTDGTYVQTASYYIFTGGKMARIKRNAKSVKEALADRLPQIDNFIATNNINAESEEDLKKVLDYYNSL